VGLNKLLEEPVVVPKKAGRPIERKFNAGRPDV
jgi:hypothetical protein